MTKPIILVVEDEWMVAEDIRSSLDAHGYTSFVATSGEEALVLVERLNPQLVLMDVHLKGEMLGTETANKIRELFDIPIIYLTAHANQATLETAPSY
jgi:CheY-like chemotaxis protein